MPGPDPIKTRSMRGPKGEAGRPKSPRNEIGNSPKEDKILIIEMGKDGPKVTNKKMFIDNMGNVEFKAKGGRAGYKMGSKCKLAMKGKGRAYGKNS